MYILPLQSKKQRASRERVFRVLDNLIYLTALWHLQSISLSAVLAFAFLYFHCLRIPLCVYCYFSECGYWLPPRKICHRCLQILDRGSFVTNSRFPHLLYSVPLQWLPGPDLLPHPSQQHSYAKLEASILLLFFEIIQKYLLS